MPTVQPGSKVLVTGANGYIAIWVVRTLLEQGYVVRGTVRSEAKGQHLKKSFEKYGDKFDAVVVEDITKDGAFDDAVKGIDAIEHTASPFYLNADDPQELIVPAVKGTVGILGSALRHGQSVKRIVVTSSAASILSDSGRPRVFSELDWNDQAIQLITEQGRSATGAIKYRASKTLAEKAAWSFYADHKAEIGWDLVVLNPPFVFGPFIHEVRDAASLNTSSAEWYNAVVSGTVSGEALTKGSSWIDVRDLGLAHVKAIQKEEAGGERIIVSAGPHVWQYWIDAANALKPSPIPSRTLAKGDPEASKNAVHLFQYDTTKAQKIFAMEYRSMQETARDILADFEARGW
jgi:nucleoside-diphosphate-sugar epimerase